MILSALLKNIKEMLPPKYNIILTDLPATGDCLVLTEQEIVFYGDLRSDLVLTESKVHFFVRVAPKPGIYEEVMADLSRFVLIMDTPQHIPEKTILNVSEPTIVFSGRDKDSNLLFSMTTKIIYYKER